MSKFEDHKLDDAAVVQSVIYEYTSKGEIIDQTMIAKMESMWM